MTLTGLSWLMPAAFTAGGAFPVRVLYRNGSVFDFGTSTSAVMSTAVWSPLLTASVTTTGALAPLSGSLSLTLPARARGALWFAFTDGTRPSRDANVKQSAVSSLPNFTTTADGALTLSYAMQAR